MIAPGEPTPLAVTMDEAKDALRMNAGHDDVLSGMLRAATVICEQYTGLWLVARTVVETMPITGDWQRLSATPVQAITGAVGVPADGATFALPVQSHAMDIDSRADGWVRVTQPGSAGRVRVTYRAGMAETAGRTPDALRQGIILLAGHMMRDRDRDAPAQPPAAVAALWRPWRRMRLA